MSSSSSSSRIISGNNTTLALSIMATGAGLMWLWMEGRRQYKYRIPSSLLLSDYSEELKLALKLALKCGKNMKNHYDTKGTILTMKQSAETDLGISTKGNNPNDFCTAIDLKNEETIIKAIRKQFPTHSIIGEEETTSERGSDGTIPPLNPSKPTWIIDPIDGTTNFASALPLACVSIGYCDVGGKPVMGVVYAPFTDELYLAIDGLGAYRNGERLVIGDNNKKKILSQAVVNVEFGYGRGEETITRMTKAVTNVLRNGCLTMRILGSGVLDLCYVASGRLDVVYAGVADEGWNPWDYCAGVCIVAEAGAKLEALTKPGLPFDLYSKSIVCATSQELLEETRKVVLEGL